MLLNRDIVSRRAEMGEKTSLTGLQSFSLALRRGPEIGIRGNTHFPFSDLNSADVADQMSKFLRDKGLD